MSLSFITFLKEAQLTVCDIDPAQQHHLRRWGCLGMQIVVPTLDLLSHLFFYTPIIAKSTLLTSYLGS